MSSIPPLDTAASPTEPSLLTIDDLIARYQGLVPKRTIDHWRYTGKGPPFIKIGRRVLYPLSGVIAWEEKRLIHRELMKTPTASTMRPCGRSCR